MKQSTKILMAITLALGIGGCVAGVGKHHYRDANPEDKIARMTERVTDKLDLNTVQQQKLQALADDMLVLMQTMKANKATHKRQIETMLKTPVFDQAGALQMLKERTHLMNEKAPMLIASLASFLDSLDAEQKSRLQPFVAKWMDRHGHGHAKHNYDQ